MHTRAVAVAAPQQPATAAAPPPAPQSPQPLDAAMPVGCVGSTLGWAANFGARFALGRELGRGSFGVVRAAVHLETGVEYAVKIIPKCRGGGSSGNSGNSSGNSGGGGGNSGAPLTPQSLTPAATQTGAGAPGGAEEAIEREAASWAAAQQRSRFVARLRALYEEEGAALLVSELVGEGLTLKARLEAAPGGRLPEAEAAAVLRCVLDVLTGCHARGLVFGDVKPANFIYASSAAADDDDGSDGGVGGDVEQELGGGSSGSSGGSGGEREGARVTVRAVDFGCSRVAPVTRPSGSPLYMAPDMGQRRFGTGVDVWAAGVMAYQMLTGRLPFWGGRVTLKEAARLPPYAVVAAARTHEVEFPLDAGWADVGDDARALVASMLERDPARRVTAAAALAHPWFERALGYAPAPSGGGGDGGEEAPGGGGGGGEVAFSDRIAALHL